MGRKDPARPGRHRRGHLVALTVSLFLTCWPGKPGWVGVSGGGRYIPGGERDRCDRCLRLPEPPRGQSGGLLLSLAKASITVSQVGLVFHADWRRHHRMATVGIKYCRTRDGQVFLLSLAH